jgi:hypothetical protein
MTLGIWLDQATINIEVRAAERIRQEYAAHLEDALGAGTSEQTFVTELGSAAAANADFIRTYLTLGEVSLLDAHRGPLHPRWLWLYGLLSFCCVTLALFISPVRSLLVAALMMAGLAFWFWLRAARRSGRLSTRQAGQLCWDAAIGISGLGLALAFGQISWLLFSFTVLTGIGVRRWRKLRLDHSTSDSGRAA